MIIVSSDYHVHVCAHLLFFNCSVLIIHLSCFSFVSFLLQYFHENDLFRPAIVSHVLFIHTIVCTHFVCECISFRQQPQWWGHHAGHAGFFHPYINQVTYHQSNVCFYPLNLMNLHGQRLWYAITSLSLAFSLLFHRLVLLMHKKIHFLKRNYEIRSCSQF